MMDSLLKKAYGASQKGQSFAFATIIETTAKGTPRKTGSKMVVLSDGSIVGTIGGGRNEKAVIAKCLEAIKTEKPTIVTCDYFGHEGQSVCGGQMKVFVEPFAGKRHFIICGAGHIALPLSVIGKMLNFKVTIIDDREELANAARFPHVDKIVLGNHALELVKQQIDRNTYIMIVTQGNEYDYECLKAVVGSEAAYIGVISSKAKRIKFLKRLKDAGIAQNDMKTIFIPAGLDLGAQTPEEIAVSISAEIVSRTNQNWKKSAKFIEKTTPACAVIPARNPC